ncbi:MAG TPA: ABC transporter permease [Anaerolineaceae bacterium]|jgi:osmoprotectant transport system permease protein
MQILMGAYTYALSHSAELINAIGQHLVLSGVAIAAGILIGFPSGVLTSRSRLASLTLMNLLNALRVIPSLAILFLIIPYLGLSTSAAAVALAVLALPPILINTDAAFRGVSPAVREAALGMGMTRGQLFWRVEFPLALPVALTGLRTAMVEVISSATLAAFVGSGGLGIYITRGFALFDISILLVGAVPVALLTVLAELILSVFQRAAEPPGVVTAKHTQRFSFMRGSL